MSVVNGIIWELNEYSKQIRKGFNHNNGKYVHILTYRSEKA